jgi:DNA invertase Pin-like site-specific DNA recombinase
MLSAAAAQYRLCEQAILDTQALRVLAELLEALPGAGFEALHSHPKITAQHRQRKAIVYLRQSTERQVRHNTESQRLQYELADRARALGFQQVEIIDTDLGRSGAVQREGFQCLIASVAIGEVGMVLSREVSRLSRTDKDWCQLLELCQLFDTLVADAEQVYDVSTMADQLVLGIKGTLSVVELKILRQRMQQGMEAKARRGELVRLLPPGYLRDASGDIVKDPDQRVQEAIARVFGIFRQTFLWFKSRGLELPVNKRRDQKMTLVWQVPSQSFIRSILHNPCYAGAYVWGQRPTELVFIDGKLVKRTSKLQRPEDCRVFIPDHHERYIDWDTFQDNQRIMRSNANRTEPDEAVGAVRAGKGLLVGLLRCGRCGRKMHVRYWGKSGTSPRYGCAGEFADGGSYCLTFGGAGVDRRFTEELLRVLTPLGIQASLEAVERTGRQEQARRQALERQRQQFDYEVQRAFEQYNEVDPRHRLVAAELERRWNAKLEELEAVTTALAAVDHQTRVLSEAERAALLRLGERFAEVWDSPYCPVEPRKTIMRTVVKEVIVNVDAGGETLQFIIHWHGGSHTRFEMSKPQWGVADKTAPEAIELICEMAVRYSDEEIARVLNKHGRRTGKGNRWTKQRVAAARRKYVIDGHRRPQPDPELLWRQHKGDQTPGRKRAFKARPSRALGTMGNPTCRFGLSANLPGIGPSPSHRQAGPPRGWFRCPANALSVKSRG